jgi:hypothetical protein
MPQLRLDEVSHLVLEADLQVATSVRNSVVPQSMDRLTDLLASSSKV